MGDASYAQYSFLGGQWSQYAQGRADRQDYRTALNLCYNSFPVEEGAWTRRPGTMQLCPTRNGVPGVIRAFDFEQDLPYLMEFTPGFLRFHQGATIASEDENTVLAIDANDPATVTTGTVHDFSIGDTVLFTLQTLVGPFSGVAALLQKQFIITAIPADNQVTISDSLLGPFDGSRVDLGTSTVGISKVVEFPTSYLTDLQSIRVVQNDTDAFILTGGPVQVVSSLTPPGTAFATFAFTPAVFNDGPYLDPPTDSSTLTPTGTTGSILLTASAISQINAGQGFVGTDVGRLIRLYSQPAAYVAATVYTAGEIVTFGGTPFTAIVGSTNAQPDINPTTWAINPEGAIWTWGTITTVIDNQNVNLTLADPAVDAAGDPLAGGDLLYELPITVYRLGMYSDTTGYPTCGTYHEGRLWFGGGFVNSFASSVSNAIPVTGIPASGISFAPTDLYGTVSDNSGITEVLNLPQIAAIFWISPYLGALVMGTQGGEIVIQASSLNDPLTPTSIQAHETTHFGCENIEPRRTGMSTVFVRRYGRKLTEYISDVYSQKFSGTNLSVTAGGLMGPGIAEIGYQMETSPIMWVRMNDDTLLALTYRRDSPFGTQPASFAGWHTHTLGTNRAILSIAVGPAVGGDFDALSLVTQDPATDFCYIETMTPIFLESDAIQDAWFVDGAVNPAGSDLVMVGGQNYVRFYGLDYVIGQTITVWGAGIDLGDFVVAGDGTIDVPIDQGGLLTTNWLLSLEGSNPRFPTQIVAASPPIVYTMSAEQNWDALNISKIKSGILPSNGFSAFTDQAYVGMSYDQVRRSIIYSFSGFNTELPDIEFRPRNNTPFTLWDGTTAYAPGDFYADGIGQSFYLCVKDIATGVVTFYDTYSPISVVPAGVGGSDGTFRRKLLATYEMGNLPKIVDPRTGNIWMTAPFNGAFLLRRLENYKQTISPLQTVETDTDFYSMEMLGITQNWAYVMQFDFLLAGGQEATSLVLTPRDLTDYETTTDFLTAYATFAYPSDVDPISAYSRACFDQNNNMYLFGGAHSGTRGYKLYQFTEPTGMTYGSLAGGGFTDITPWTSGSGPNIGSSGYTLNTAAEPNGSGGVNKNILMYLPSTNQLVAISKNFPGDHTTSSTNPTLLTFDCTYYDIAGIVFDYQASFVTGYMDAFWQPTIKATAAYAVQDCYEIDPYLNLNSFVFNDKAYDRRWFAFTVQPVTNGNWSYDTTTNKMVFVEYEFVYGQSPAVVQILDESGWDATAAGTAYGETIGNLNVVSQSIPDKTNNGQLVDPFTTIYADSGIYDAPGGAFWFSGDVSQFKFFNPLLPSVFIGEDLGCPPFLKLAWSQPATYTTSFALGTTYASRGQILRPIAPQEAGAQNGPALGKTRRTHMYAALLSSTQGISFGTDFTKMYPAALTAYVNGPPLPLTTLYSGTKQGTLSNDYSFDSMPCWEITRPYPATVAAFEAFLHTQDR